jgi:hypothetical protein
MLITLRLQFSALKDLIVFHLGLANGKFTSDADEDFSPAERCEGEDWKALYQRTIGAVAGAGNNPITRYWRTACCYSFEGVRWLNY